MGTPTYMSPEQCEGSASITDRVDVYSLGIMTFELLTGSPPFTSDSMAAVLRMHIVRNPPPLPASIPAPLSTMVAQMLAKEPKERPSMAEVAQRLEELFGGRASSTAVPVTGSQPRKLPFTAVAIATGVSVIAALTGWLVLGRKPTPVVEKPIPPITGQVTTAVPTPPKEPDKATAPIPTDETKTTAKPESVNPPSEKKPGKSTGKTSKSKEPKDPGGNLLFNTKKTKKGLPL